MSGSSDTIGHHGVGTHENLATDLGPSFFCMLFWGVNDPFSSCKAWHAHHGRSIPTDLLVPNPLSHPSSLLVSPVVSLPVASIWTIHIQIKSVPLVKPPKEHQEDGRPAPKVIRNIFIKQTKATCLLVYMISCFAMFCRFLFDLDSRRTHKHIPPKRPATMAAP